MPNPSFRTLALGAATAALLFSGLVASCAPQGKPGGGSAPVTTSALGSRIKVEDATGTTLFELKPSDKGFQIDDKAGKKLGTVKVEADRVKVADASGKPAFKVKQKDAGFKLYNEPANPGGADVEILNYQPDGADFRIKDGSDRELYRGKSKGAKTEVTGPGGRRYALKPKPDGIEVEDPAGKRLLRIKGVSSAAAATLAVDPELDTLQKAAVVGYEASRR